MSDSAVLDSAVSDSTVSDSAVSDSAVSESAVLDSAVSDIIRRLHLSEDETIIRCGTIIRSDNYKIWALSAETIRSLDNHKMYHLMIVRLYD